MKTALIIILLAATLTGCPKGDPVARPAAPLGVGAEVVAANSAAVAAAVAAADAGDKRLSKLKANVDAIVADPNLSAVPAAQNEALVAQGRLAGVVPDPAEVAAVAERRSLVETGRAPEARAAAEAAADQGRAEAERIGELEAEAKRERARADAVCVAFTAQAARNMVANQKAIDSALDAQRNGVLKNQVSWLNRIGFGCLAGAALVVGLGIGFGGLAIIRRVVPLAVALTVIGLFAFGAAQILGAWWFLPAVGVAGSGAAIWFGVWAWRHYKREDLAQELAAHAAKVAGVAQTAVPVLDAAYEQAEAPIKAWMDAHIFDRLSSLMDREGKATVHAIRAQASTPLPKP